MHIKAIQIKEQLLGHEDYEVALSVGHLASLYNYDMNQYEDAERLYLRSIAIGQSAADAQPLWLSGSGCSTRIGRVESRRSAEMRERLTDRCYLCPGR